jgi:heat shock protein beta
MQRIITSQTHSKTQDMQRDYYLNQKKTLEINPRHPLIKELLRRVEDNPADNTAKNMALMMFNTATLRFVHLLKCYMSVQQHTGTSSASVSDPHWLYADLDTDPDPAL